MDWAQPLCAPNTMVSSLSMYSFYSSATTQGLEILAWVLVVISKKISGNKILLQARCLRHLDGVAEGERAIAGRGRGKRERPG